MQAEFFGEAAVGAGYRGFVPVRVGAAGVRPEAGGVIFERARCWIRMWSPERTKTETALWRRPRRWVSSLSVGVRVPLIQAGMSIMTGLGVVWVVMAGSVGECKR